jgi:hypothetical protein
MKPRSMPISDMEIRWRSPRGAARDFPVHHAVRGAQQRIRATGRASPLWGKSATFGISLRENRARRPFAPAAVPTTSCIVSTTPSEQTECRSWPHPAVRVGTSYAGQGDHLTCHSMGPSAANRNSRSFPASSNFDGRLGSRKVSVASDWMARIRDSKLIAVR